MSYIGRFDTCNVLNENTTSEVVKLEQNYLILNQDEIGQGIDEDQGGIIIERGQLPDAVLRFNEDINSWEYGVEGHLKLLGKKAVKINSSTLTIPDFVYLVDTTNQELSLLLPQQPYTGMEVEFIDLKGTFDINNVIVLGNGSRIVGTTENAYLDIKFTNIKFIYVDFDIGWVLAPSNPITLSSNAITNELSTEQIENIIQVLNQSIAEIGPNIISYINNNIANLNVQQDSSINLEIKNSDFTAEKNKYYRINTANNTVSINLPPNPQDGDWVTFSDSASSFEMNSVTVLYDGIKTIHNNAGDLELDVNNTNAKLIYSDNNWFVTMPLSL